MESKLVSKVNRITVLVHLLAEAVPLAGRDPRPPWRASKWFVRVLGLVRVEESLPPGGGSSGPATAGPRRAGPGRSGQGGVRRAHHVRAGGATAHGPYPVLPVRLARRDGCVLQGDLLALTCTGVVHAPGGEHNWSSGKTRARNTVY